MLDYDWVNVLSEILQATNSNSKTILLCNIQ